MGGACCVAARDKNIVNGSSTEILRRNIMYSPTWSFQWENRGRVAGEETSIASFSDVNSRNSEREVKNESAYASDEGSPLDVFLHAWQKSPLWERTNAHLRSPSDQSFSRNVSIDTSFEQVEPIESPTVANPSPTKLSLSLPSTSSIKSPLSSQSHLHPASSTAPSRPQHSNGHQLMAQVSDNRIPEYKSINSCSVSEGRSSVPSWSKESTRGSHGGSSDGWSMHAFSELMATSQREGVSLDNESWGFSQEKTRSSGRISVSLSVDFQTCGICSKLTAERSLWSSQKFFSSNEPSVVSVLTCGHVYHAECLETMTPEISKYDPPCPVCTLGEKQTLKLSQKAFKAEMNAKAKTKRSRKRIVDSDLDGDSVVFDRLKGIGYKGKGAKMGSSSSMKSSLAKPFLKRHFSFGLSRGSKSLSENHMTKKKGFFWTRSIKA